MKNAFTIRHLLSALAVLGLILAPISTPAMALSGGMDASMDANVMVMSGDASMMSADMPCCPKELPTRDCGKECALMAMCTTLILQIPAPVASPNYPIALASRFTSRNDASRDSLAQAPPPRPPRI